MPLSFCDCYDSPPHSLVARLRTAPAARLKVTQPRFFVVDSLPVLSRCLFPFNLSIFVFLEMNLKHSKQRYSVKHTFNSPKKKKKKKSTQTGQYYALRFISSTIMPSDSFFFHSFETKRKYVWNSTDMNEIVGFLFPSRKRGHTIPSSEQKKKKKKGISGLFLGHSPGVCAQGHTVAHQYCRRHTRFL